MPNDDKIALEDKVLFDLKSKSAFRFKVNVPSDGKSVLLLPSDCTQIFTVLVVRLSNRDTNDFFTNR